MEGPATVVSTTGAFVQLSGTLVSTSGNEAGGGISDTGPAVISVTGASDAVTGGEVVVFWCVISIVAVCLFVDFLFILVVGFIVVM